MILTSRELIKRIKPELSKMGIKKARIDMDIKDGVPGLTVEFEIDQALLTKLAVADTGLSTEESSIPESSQLPIPPKPPEARDIGQDKRAQLMSSPIASIDWERFCQTHREALDLMKKL